MNMEKMYESMGISVEVYAYGQKIEKELKSRFEQIDETAEYNQLKVIRAKKQGQRRSFCREQRIWL